MIDYLSAFSKKIGWLKPLLLFTTVTAFIVFGYVIFFANEGDKDIYIIPCIVSVLWSLFCWLVLSFFPFVPPRINKQQPFSVRLKNGMVRGFYHTISLILVFLSLFALFLTLRLLSIWRVNFHS